MAPPRWLPRRVYDSRFLTFVSLSSVPDIANRSVNHESPDFGATSQLDRYLVSISDGEVA